MELTASSLDTVKPNCESKIDATFIVLSASAEAHKKWKAIGTGLGFDHQYLEAIKQQHGREPADCLRVLLTTWLQRFDNATTYPGQCHGVRKALIGILCQPAVGLNHIADEIEARTCKNYTKTDCRDQDVSNPNSSGGASNDSEDPEDNNPLESSNLTQAIDLGIPDERRVKAFRTESQLVQQTRCLELEFFKLLILAKSSLAEQKVCTYEVSIHVAEFVDIKPLMEAKDINTFFERLAPLTSWFNYALLEAIINQFATEEVQEAMSQYISRLQSTLEGRKVAELPPHVYHEVKQRYNNPKTLENNWKKLGIKIDYEWNKFLIKDVLVMRERIASILGIDERSLFLLSVTEGCVHLEFLVPDSVSQLILDLEPSSDIYSELIEARVIEVECNSVIVYTDDFMQQMHAHAQKYMYTCLDWLQNDTIEVS